MRKYLALALALAAIAACARPQPTAQARPETKAATGTATVASAPSVRQPLYVDVRTPEEFAAGHLSGAINIPVDQMEQRWSELKAYPDRPVVLYCRSGHRAGIALEILRRKGFDSATNGGGLEQLRRQGLK